MDDDNAHTDDAFGEMSASDERLENAHYYQTEEYQAEPGSERCLVEPSVL